MIWGRWMPLGWLVKHDKGHAWGWGLAFGWTFIGVIRFTDTMPPHLRRSQVDPTTWPDQPREDAGETESTEGMSLRGTPAPSYTRRDDPLVPARPKSYPAIFDGETPMTDSERLQFLTRLLSTVAFDNRNDLWWRWRLGGAAPSDEDDVLDFYVNCDDLFVWGAADCEAVTPENIGVLEQAYRDCPHLGSFLFCARVRQMRPQGVWCVKGFIGPDDMHWFEVFPERPVGLGNPDPWMTKADYARQHANSTAE